MNSCYALSLLATSCDHFWSLSLVSRHHPHNCTSISFISHLWPLRIPRSHCGVPWLLLIFHNISEVNDWWGRLSWIKNTLKRSYPTCWMWIFPNETRVLFPCNNAILLSFSCQVKGRNRLAKTFLCPMKLRGGSSTFHPC
jgi:hypothetical protein